MIRVILNVLESIFGKVEVSPAERADRCTYEKPIVKPISPVHHAENDYVYIGKNSCIDCLMGDCSCIH